MEQEREAIVYDVEEGGILLIPSDATKIHEKLDDCSDCSSVYSEDAQLALDENPASLLMTKEELQRHLLRFGLDANGLPIRDDLLFRSYDAASGFSARREHLSVWKALAGFRPRQIEVPHVVLWDYSGGHSCLDVNVTAGDVVNVVADEYQVRKFANFTSDNRDYLRLPTKWSFARCITGKTFQGDAGLIPSSWLVAKDFYDANPKLFVKPKWFLGVCSLFVAYNYMLNDKKTIAPGMFVIFSPQWLNLNPKDYRPYILLVMSKKNNGKGMTQAASISPAPAKSTSKGTKEGEEPEEMTSEKRREEEKEMAVLYASLPYYIKRYMIQRSELGRYLLFGNQFLTLYDLVHHLTISESHLPHFLTEGPSEDVVDLYFRGVPPPFADPKRDIHALPMRCEQWAARHYDQVTEPALLNQGLSYVSRALFDPFKKIHRHYAKLCGMREEDLAAASNEIMKYKRPTPKSVAGDEFQNRLVEEYKRTATDRLNVTKSDDDYNERNKLFGAERRDQTKIPNDEFVLRSASAEIKQSDVQFNDKDTLGKGAFATVYKGKVKTSKGLVDSAIKRLKIVPPSQDVRHPWVAEIEMLQLISHPNCVKFYGYCYDEKLHDVFLAFELMEGALDSYIQKHIHQISVNERIDFMIQIARGMGHLHAMDPQIVHGDLAARNVLMKAHPKDDSRFIVKVTDFGLSKVTPSDMHVIPDDPDTIPFNWLAPETWFRREFTAKTDIWTYGMTALELFGVKVPFGMNDRTIVMLMLKEGNLHGKPPDMPDYVFEILLKCWRKSPVDRPTFPEIEAMLKPLYIEAEEAHMKWVQDRWAPKSDDDYCIEDT